MCDLLEGLKWFQAVWIQYDDCEFLFKRTNFISLSLPFCLAGSCFWNLCRCRVATLSVAPWESWQEEPRVYSPANRCQPLLRSGLLESGLGLQELITKFVTRMEVKSTPSCHAQLCRNVCSVCRAPVPPGQAVNILIRLLLNSIYGAEAESFGAASCVWFLRLISEEVWSLSSGHGMFVGFSCSRWSLATSVFVLKRYPRALAQRRQEQQEAVWPAVKKCQCQRRRALLLFPPCSLHSWRRQKVKRENMNTHTQSMFGHTWLIHGYVI